MPSDLVLTLPRLCRYSWRICLAGRPNMFLISVAENACSSTEHWDGADAVYFFDFWVHCFRIRPIYSNADHLMCTELSRKKRSQFI